MNILVTLADWMFPDIMEDDQKAKLKTLGRCTFRTDLTKETTEEEYSAAIKAADAEIVMICWGAPKVTTTIMDDNPQFKYLLHLSGELGQYLERDVFDKGLLVTNWGNVISRSVAEGAVMMMLAGLRNTVRFDAMVHNGGWADDSIPRTGLFEKKVGLLGFGAIAQAAVKLLQPWDCPISAYDPNCPDAVFEEFGVQRIEQLEQLFEESDILSLHAARTPDTHHIVNADSLAKMKDGALLVNTARGALIDTDALIAELKTGRISAALDVYEKEPLEEDSPLRDLENCILMPHQGGPTPDRRVDMGRQAVKNVAAYVNGDEVENVITAEKFDRMT